MPFNGAGVYNPIAAPDFPAVAGTTVRASQYNSQIIDLGSALSNCFTRDGQGAALANIPMGGWKVTGLANGTSSNDAINLSQLINQVNVETINGVPYSAASGKNLLRNAQGLINQRNVSGTVTLAAGIYGHDGFVAGPAGCSYTFSTVNGETTFTILTGTLAQMVRGQSLLGGTNTYCLSNDGTAQMRINSGSYTSDEVSASLTYGTNVRCEFGAGTVKLPQFEPNISRTSFDYKSEEEHRKECLQEFWRVLPTDGFYIRGGTFAGGGTFKDFRFSFPYPMNATPSINLTSAGLLSQLNSIQVQTFTKYAHSFVFGVSNASTGADWYYILSTGFLDYSCEVAYA